MFYLIKTKLKKLKIKSSKTRTSYGILLCFLFCLGYAVFPHMSDAVEHPVEHKLSLKKKTQKKDLMETSRLEDHIRHLERDAQKLSQAQLENVRELDGVNHEINQRQLRISLISEEIGELTDKIKELELRRQPLMDAIETHRCYVNERLLALYRIKTTGYWQLFPRPGSAFDFWKRQQALTRIIRSDVSLLETQIAILEDLEKTSLLIEGETGEKKLLEAHQALEIENLEKKRKKRRELLDSVQEKRALNMAAMNTARKALEQTMRALKIHGVAASGPEKNKSGKSAAKMSKQSNFLSSKGSLSMPVKGAVISKFGSRTGTDDNIFTFQTGIDIKADRGEPVRCVFRGEVLYADWLKGYGNLIIINHGDNYYTLYAHMEELFKKKGDVVENHEVIATAGDTGSLRGTSLHFEVRHHGKPVDPLQWLKKGA